ncbi:ABC transporter ATP-binding protein [candidate division WOR-3 bacterium]|uniref:ABC transporter ATP-binding protein n=1 Tax=candidate division WOR-3 bacterium TaxID=2052148 RepID=A0A660SM10_UNCW3|nr:MAG: ABC transporter ATP-binding protein [candidate division WOR-3 bacterium]
MVAIEVEGLRKTFKKGKVVAVDGVSLTIEKGELFGLLGPNGAGKTTLIKCLSTLLIPDGGRIRIFGHDVLKESLKVRRLIGLVTGGERTLYWKLSVFDNLRYFAALYGLYGRKARRRIEEMIEVMDLVEKRDERVERLSTGMRQKVALARALLHDPELLLLDEPTLGLDPQFSRVIRRFIKEELQKKLKKTILLTTHYMEEADELCDRIGFMSQGKIAACATPEELKEKIPHERLLEIKMAGLPDESLIRNIPGVEDVLMIVDNNRTVLRIQSPDPEGILATVLERLRKECRIIGFGLTTPTLEDVFIFLTGEELR